MTEFTVTRETAQDIADRLNLQYALGRILTVNGEQLRPRVSGQNVATAWQNGTVSVTVRCRTKRGSRDLFVKAGQTLQAAL